MLEDVWGPLPRKAGLEREFTAGAGPFQEPRAEWALHALSRDSSGPVPAKGSAAFFQNSQAGQIPTRSSVTLEGALGMALLLRCIFGLGPVLCNGR